MRFVHWDVAANSVIDITAHAQSSSPSADSHSVTIERHLLRVIRTCRVGQTTTDRKGMHRMRTGLRGRQWGDTVVHTTVHQLTAHGACFQQSGMLASGGKKVATRFREIL